MLNLYRVQVTIKHHWEDGTVYQEDVCYTEKLSYRNALKEAIECQLKLTTISLSSKLVRA